MQNHLILPFLAVFLIFSACQPERINQEIATAKSEQFLAPGDPEWERTLIAADLDQVEVWLSAPIKEANSLSFDHRSTSWQEGAQAISQLAGTISTKENLTVQDRHDLELVSYMGIQNFLETAPESQERAKLAAVYLSRLMTNTKPVDWHMLSKMLLLSESALTEEAYLSTREYILKGASTTLKNTRHPDTPVSRYEISQYQARVALQKLQSK